MSGLRKNVVEVPLTGGVDEKTDPVITGKDRLLACNNYSVSKNRTLTRRDAWVALSSDVPTSDFDLHAEVLSYKDQLLTVADSGSLYSYTPAKLGGSDTEWASVGTGKASIVQISRDKIAKAVGHQEFLDSATVAGCTCFVWRQMVSAGGTGQGIRISVVDDTTGAMILNNYTMSSNATATKPRVCVYEDSTGSFFMVTCIDSGGIYGLRIQAGSGTVSGVSLVTSGLYTTGTTGLYDVFGGYEVWFVVYNSSATGVGIGAFNKTFSLFGAANVIPAATLPIADVTCLAVTRFTNTNRIAVVAGKSGTTNVYSATILYGGGAWGSPDTALATSVTTAAYMISAVATSSSAAFVLSSGFKTGSSNPAYMTSFTLTSSNTISGKQDRARCVSPMGPTLAGKLMLYGTEVYVPLQIVSSEQSALVVVDLNWNILAHCLSSSVGAVPTEGFLPSSTMLADGSASIPVFETGSITSKDVISHDVYQWTTDTPQQGVSRVRMVRGRSGVSAYRNATPLWHAQAANCMYFSGGVLTMYDGVRVSEAGFAYYPEGVAAVAHADAGFPNGVYKVCAVYEWFDSTGQRHQSKPSPTVTTASIASKKITMTCPTLQLGNARISGSSVVFYRTEAGGDQFYRDSQPSDNLYNDNTLATVTYVSNTTDAVLRTNEMLYNSLNSELTGDTLFNVPPFACRAIAAHQGRLFVANTEDPYEIRYSQSPVPNLGLNWSPFLFARIPEGYGPIVALGSMDDKLVIYTPSHTFAMWGTGPATNGSGGSYTTPQLLASDVGCFDQRSVVNIPSGQMRQTYKGIYLLNRGLSEQPIGEGVEASALAYTVTSAISLDKKSQVRMTLSNGTVLVFDVLTGQWATFTSTVATPVSACTYNNLYTMADTTTGKVLVDSPGAYKDLTTTAIVGSFTTPWLRLGAIAGFQRVWNVILSFWLRTNSAVSVSVITDYDTSQTPSTFAVAATTTTYGSTSRIVGLRGHLAKQKCAAIRFAVTDTPSGAGSWQGAEFSGLTLEIGTKYGVQKLVARSS